MKSFSISGTNHIEVAGTNYRRYEMKQALRITDPSRYERETTIAALIPEPDNPHDPQAVSVRVNGNVIGYLPREELRSWTPIIHRIVASGFIPETRCYLNWSPAYEDHIEEGGFAGATVTLPKPHLAIPLNNPPLNSTLLPPGGSSQVIKEEEHFDVLFNYVPPAGEALLYLEFKLGTRVLKNGQERATVFVYLDGEHVGELSTVTGKKFEPVLRHAADLKRAVVVSGTIKGSALTASLTFRAAKADELSDAWVNTLPQAPRFAPEAAYYSLPPAYTPSRLETHPRLKAAPTGQMSSLESRTRRTASAKGSSGSGCALVLVAGLGVATSVAAAVGRFA